MLNANDGWAAGLGAMVRWNGTAWNDVPSPTAGWLTSVFIVSANDGWAVTNVGMIFRWNGTSWNNFTSPTTERLLSLSMVSDSSGWAVGYNGTIIHWTGTEWIPEFSTGILMLLLAGFTLVSITLAKTVPNRYHTTCKRDIIFEFFVNGRQLNLVRIMFSQNVEMKPEIEVLSASRRQEMVFDQAFQYPPTPRFFTSADATAP